MLTSNLTNRNLLQRIMPGHHLESANHREYEVRAASYCATKSLFINSIMRDRAFFRPNFARPPFMLLSDHFHCISGPPQAIIYLHSCSAFTSTMSDGIYELPKQENSQMSHRVSRNSNVRTMFVGYSRRISHAGGICLCATYHSASCTASLRSNVCCNFLSGNCVSNRP